MYTYIYIYIIVHTHTQVFCPCCFFPQKINTRSPTTWTKPFKSITALSAGHGMLSISCEAGHHREHVHLPADIMAPGIPYPIMSNQPLSTCIHMKKTEKRDEKGVLWLAREGFAGKGILWWPGHALYQLRNLGWQASEPAVCYRSEK